MFGEQERREERRAGKLDQYFKPLAIMVSPRKNLNAQMQYKCHNQQERMKGEDKIALFHHVQRTVRNDQEGQFPEILKVEQSEDRTSEKQFPNSQRWPFTEIPGTDFFAVSFTKCTS